MKNQDSNFILQLGTTVLNAIKEIAITGIICLTLLSIVETITS